MSNRSHCLTEQQRWQVARQYRSGDKVKTIAERFGISINAVSYIAISRGFRRRIRRRIVI
jgi:uncharacterized protein YerC